MSLLGHHGAVSKQRNKLVHPLKNKRATHVLLPTMFSNMFESWSTPEVFAGREVTGVSGLASQEEVVCAMRVVSESETRRFLRIRPACHTRALTELSTAEGRADSVERRETRTTRTYRHQRVSPALASVLRMFRVEFLCGGVLLYYYHRQN
jgi:hypothetical protein